MSVVNFLDGAADQDMIGGLATSLSVATFENDDSGALISEMNSHSSVAGVRGLPRRAQSTELSRAQDTSY